MTKMLLNKFRDIRIGFLHAAYHRNLKKAVYIHENGDKTQEDIVQFKKYIYRAEDAWRKMVILKEKQK